MGSRRQLAPRASKSGRAIAFTLSAPTQGKNWSLCLWDSRPVVKVGPLQAAKRRRRGELRTSSWKTTSSMLPLHVPSHELQLYILISYALHKLWSRDKRHAHMRRGKLSGTQTGSHNQRTALRPQSTSSGLAGPSRRVLRTLFIHTVKRLAGYTRAVLCQFRTVWPPGALRFHASWPHTTT